MKKIRSRSMEETEKVAKDLVSKLGKEKGGEKATIVGLYGELGSGKTTFMKNVANEFGVTEVVTSPTFVIQKTYQIKNKNFSQLYHIDAYRLESGDELLTLNWEEVVNNKQNIIFIEWPERIKSILPENINKVMFTTVDENTRDIEVALI